MFAILIGEFLHFSPLRAFCISGHISAKLKNGEQVELKNAQDHCETFGLQHFPIY